MTPSTTPLKWYRIEGTVIHGIHPDTYILVSGIPPTSVSPPAFKHMKDIHRCTYRVYVGLKCIELFMHSASYPNYTRNFDPKNPPTLSQIKREIEKQIILYEL